MNRRSVRRGERETGEGVRYVTIEITEVEPVKATDWHWV